MDKPSGGKGQRHRSRAEAEQIAIEYEASGLSRQEYCERNGVAMKTLARYVARHRRGRAEKATPQRWVAVGVAKPRESRGELAVVLSSGRRIEVKRGFDAATLRQLVSVLERR